VCPISYWPIFTKSKIPNGDLCREAGSTRMVKLPSLMSATRSAIFSTVVLSGAALGPQVIASFQRIRSWAWSERERVSPASRPARRRGVRNRMGEGTIGRVGAEIGERGNRTAAALVKPPCGTGPPHYRGPPPPDAAPGTSAREAHAGARGSRWRGRADRWPPPSSRPWKCPQSRRAGAQ